MFKRPLYCIDKVIKSFKCNKGFLIFPSWQFVVAILSLKGLKSSLRAWFEFSAGKGKKRKNFQKVLKTWKEMLNFFFFYYFFKSLYCVWLSGYQSQTLKHWKHVGCFQHNKGFLIFPSLFFELEFFFLRWDLKIRSKPFLMNINHLEAK